MAHLEKQFWCNGLLLVFIAATLLGCGKKEEAYQSTPEPRSSNPELHAKDAGVSDTAAYARSDSESILGIEIDDSVVPAGALIKSVVANSEAAKHDLHPNDVITKIGDISITNAQDFKTAYSAVRPTMAITLALLRDNTFQDVALVKP